MFIYLYLKVTPGCLERASRGGPDPPEIICEKKYKLLDKQILNCYYRINTDSIPGGESPPTANPSECRPRDTQLGAFNFLPLFLPNPGIYPIGTL